MKFIFSGGDTGKATCAEMSVYLAIFILSDMVIYPSLALFLNLVVRY